ncbi:MAG: helix-turn-helix transcriptional regulator [Salinivirgaceae bacterium]|nr:helix-turn-helix transcriptional regulator [Salinivirgaceae bacterium]
MRQSDKKIFRVGILEPSAIIVNGLSNILLKAGNFDLYKIDYVADMQRFITANKLQLIIINPQLLQQTGKELAHLKLKNPNVVWCALVYSFFELKYLNQFDLQIAITDIPSEIVEAVNSKLNDESADDTDLSKQLSDRELDVLRLLAQGNMNKEIADKLNISVHTVISHRKNITQKTGIKTQSGLTIYALSNKIINI